MFLFQKRKQKEGRERISFMEHLPYANHSDFTILSKNMYEIENIISILEMNKSSLGDVSSLSKSLG